MGITGGRRLFEALCPIFIILGHQKWGDCFTYFGIDGTLLNAWEDTTIKNRHGMSIDGVCNASWLRRVDWTNVGTIFVSELVPHIPSLEQPFWQ